MSFENGINYFNLQKDGDNAIIRLLYTSTSKIEKSSSHWIALANGKKKCVKCIGDGCPLCASGSLKQERLYVHLFDYTDNKEKVWSRTDKILPQLVEVESAWGNLSNCVLKITRVGDNFPKYTITVQNPQMFAQVNPSWIDESIAYRMYCTRSKEEIEQFLATGVLPDHVKQDNSQYSASQSQAIPKSQYQQTTPFQPQQQPVSNQQFAPQQQFGSTQQFYPNAQAVGTVPPPKPQDSVTQPIMPSSDPFMWNRV